MICLNNTDVLEAWSDTDAVVDYHIFGLVGTTWTRLASGTLGNVANVVIFTATAATSIVSMRFTNNSGAAATVNLKLDPADGGNDKFMSPVAISLEAGYALVDDGQRFSVMDTSGQILNTILSIPAHKTTHENGGGDAIKLDDLAAPDDNTDLDFDTSKHGLVPKGTDVGDFLKDDGSWDAAGGSVSPRDSETKTANYVLQAGDGGKTIEMDNAAARTFTFPALATLGAGWWVTLVREGAGKMSIIPDGAEEIGRWGNNTVYNDAADEEGWANITLQVSYDETKLIVTSGDGTFLV